MLTKTNTRRRKVAVKPARTPRTRKPEEMSLEEWQVALRREHGREQDFSSKNLGTEPVFSDFAVTNPRSKRTYRVAVRGGERGVNFCTCPDFAVNTLGTCKHIEWLLAKLERRHGGKKAFAAGFHPPYSSVFLQYGSRRRVRFRAGAACPAHLRSLARNYFDEEGVLREGAHATFESFVHDALRADPEFRVYPDALAYVARLRDDEKRRKEISQSYEGPRAAAAFKDLLKVNLYPYQQKGAVFAAKAGRCLLADDMGLGKTIQAIGAAEILARTAGIEHVLVVCPTALKHQWKQEIERFTGRCATVVEGLTPMRRRLYEDEAFYKIVNYDVIHRDLAFINATRPDLVVLDEAQRIKNWDTRRAKSVKQIDTNFAIVLTGTPLENRLAELHSLMEFVDKFHLGPLFRFLDLHQHTDEVGRVIGYRNLDAIKKNLSAVLLRRRKQEVLQELPERTDKYLFVDMTDAQRKIHEENRETVTRIVAKWRRFGFLSDEDQRRLMIALQLMRMSCNSTFLIDKQTDQGPKMDECCLLLDDILAIPENKVVIFSQWLGTHELLIRRFRAVERPYAFYHGSLDSKARKEVLERFKKDPECRVLLCTDSGGVGLNLQFASVLINMDQPWNPAVLEQRIGRIHRLGQHRPVHVYHLVSRGTIEQGMLGVLKFKSSLFEGVLDGGESEIFLGGTKMKQFMETVEKVSKAMPDHMTTVEENTEPEPTPAATVVETPEETPAPVPPAQAPAWQDMLDTGLSFLAKLGAAVQTPSAQQPAAPSLARLVSTNEHSGQPEIRIPLPDPDTAQKLGNLLAGLGEFLKSMR